MNYDQYHEPDFNDRSKRTKKYKITAWCTSNTCDRIFGRTTIPGIRGVEKNVSKTTSICPDCHLYLFWDKKEVV